jgi:3-deoxy-manno-octulosonate cytidylyltransferase (CMP-KDO synthetase)
VTEADYKIVIPARFSSTRFPGKPLALIDGVPMVIRVYQRVMNVTAGDVIVATDDERIADACKSHDAPVCMTQSDHPTGTDRVAEVCRQMQWPDDTVIVNVQGDEPLIPLSSVEQVAGNLQTHPDASIATLCTPITDAQEFADPNNVKVVFDHRGMAMYFSRAPIPFERDNSGDVSSAYRHLGLYAYRADFLARYGSLSACMVEDLEKLEQLRALWNGERIHVGVASELPGPGVDTPEQLAEVEALLKSSANAAQ